MERVIYTLWLQSCIGYANSYVKQIIETFTSAEKIYHANEYELRISGLFTKSQINRLTDKNLDGARRIYERSVASGIRIITISSREYPASLRDISSPPLVLYVRGELPSADCRKIAIVGSREPTPLGKRLSFGFSNELAGQGAAIISGGALGVDTQAHKGAIQAGGKTVCVLGCGVNYKYLMENAPLREEISRHGAVISEYPVDMPPASYTFRQRNRIIVAIADCTLVVEGALMSGSLISASMAVQQHAVRCSRGS